MMADKVISELNSKYRKFDGCDAAIMSYSDALSTILRIRINDKDENEWIMSFDECQFIQGQSNWKISNLSFSSEDGVTVCEDKGGRFRVDFERCFLISEEEHWKSNN